MDSKQILSADLLDLVFDNRNKDYGAYELRKFYNRRIAKALTITAAIAGIAFTTLALANNSNPHQIKKIDERMVTITELPPPEVLPEPEPEPPAAKEPEPTKTEQFTKFDIVDNDKVEEPPPTHEDLSVAAIGVAKQDGAEDKGLADLNEPVDHGTGIIAGPENKEPQEPFRSVEVEAKFSGNWEKFLLRNLNGNIPVDNGATAGRYTVMIQFVVDIDGSVSDIKPLTTLGFGMEQEAVRVLKKAAKWEPAIQNGRQVKAYRKQLITFLVNED